ncbi:MAG: CCA tRNA nucleotidyltransferase [Gemmatimonadaceae bacterium]
MSLPAMPLPGRVDPPPAVRELVVALERAGFETWCVGGAVRDALLGRPDLDWDLATAARPAEVRRVFGRTVPVGIEFGTVGVFDRDGRLHEVTTFRRDVRTDGRHAVVEFGASLDADLARRDFTINAIAYSPSRNELRDPFGGMGDLSRGVIKAVGEARQRMQEDRLRALRAMRFAGRLDFAIEPATWRSIVESAPYLSRLSRERVKQEIEKTLEQVPKPSLTFRLWRDGLAFAQLLPDLASIGDAALSAIDMVPLPRAALSSAHARARSRVERSMLLRLALLFVPLAGREIASVMRNLRFSNQQVARTVQLVTAAQALGSELRAALLTGAPPPDAAVRRWAARAGRTVFPLVLRLAAAQWAAQRVMLDAAPTASAIRSFYRRAVTIAYRDPVEIADLAIDGSDLLEAGVAPGPQVGQILAVLLDDVLQDPSCNTRETLLARARDRAGV